jgi:hypothetical protein
MEQLVAVQRFGQIMKCPGFDRLDGRVDTAKSGYDDHRHIRRSLLDLPEHLESGNLLHFEVGKHKIAREFGEKLKTLLPVRSHDDAVPRLLELKFNNPPKTRIVIDD